MKVNYAHNKPAVYSLDGKEISIGDAATVTTSDETKTFKCEAGTYVVNGKTFETSTDLTFTADTNEIKLPLNDARTEIYFDGVKVNGVAGGEEIVFDLANDKISIPGGALLNVTSPEEVKLNLAAGTFTIDGKTIITDNALEITADKDSIQVPLENVVTIDEAKIIGTGAATIDNTDEYLYSILLPNGALVQNDNLEQVIIFKLIMKRAAKNFFGKKVFLNRINTIILNINSYSTRHNREGKADVKFEQTPRYNF